MRLFRAGPLLRLAVAALLTVLILWKSNPSEVAAALAGARPAYIVLAVVLVVLDRTLMAYRWILLLEPYRSPAGPSLGVVIKVFLVSTFVGTFLPASVGGDAVRAYSLARHQVSGAAALASVFMDRVLGVLSILVLVVGGVWLGRELARDQLVFGILAVSTFLCLVVAILIFNGRAGVAAAGVVQALPVTRLHSFGRQLIEALQRYRGHHALLLLVLGCSVGVQAIRVIQAYWLGRALGIEATLGIYFVLIPVILLIMLLPITVNGIGTSQAAFVWFFGRAGVSSHEAFALSVLFVALGIVGNLPGGLLYAASGSTLQEDHLVRKG